MIKSIEKTADENSDDPFLVGIKERAEAVEERYEDRQLSTQDALREIQNIYEADIRRKKDQAEKGLDNLNYFVYSTLLDKGINNPNEVSKSISEAFVKHPNWKDSEKELRDLRLEVYAAIFPEEKEMNKVTGIVDELFKNLFTAYKL